MLRTMLGTGIVAASFLLLAVVFAGIGLGLRRLFGLREVGPGDGFTGFWVGFATVLAFLLLWNFAFPVDTTAFALVLAAGAAGLYACRHDLTPPTRAGLGTERPGLALVVVVGLWVANLATGPMVNWDTSLYHMQGVLWAESYPAVPGLANLFGPLGFNNATFLYGALLDAGFPGLGGWHLANGLLIAVAAAQSLRAGARLFRPGPGSMGPDLFAFLLLAPVLSLATGSELTSYVPDVALTLVRLATLALWYRMLVAPATGLAGAFDLVAVVILSAAAVAIKMNALVIALLTVPTAALLWYRREPAAARYGARVATWAVTIAVLFGGAWGARGVVLSGYLAFPSPAFAAEVEWRAPVDHARAEFEYVVHSTRSSTGNLEFVRGNVTGLAAWLPRWLESVANRPYDVAIPLGAALLFLPLLWSGAPAPGTARAWWMVPPALGAVAAWFLTAPAPRYMPGVFWLFPALVAGQGLARLEAANRTPPRWRLGLLALALGFSPAVAVPFMAWRKGTQEDSLVLTILRANVNLPRSPRLVDPIAGRPELHPFRTETGLVLQVPSARCWDAPPPCTPNPAPNLRLRVPGSLASGFVVEGPWRMRDWPEPWKGDYGEAWREAAGMSPPGVR